MHARTRSVPVRDSAPPPAAQSAPHHGLRAVKGRPSETPSASKRRRWLTPSRVSYLVTAAVLTWGLRFPTAQYITPQSGLGYALGILGGSAMLLLMIYPARKRLPQLRVIGSNKLWFQIHMVLGVLGPVLILFHSNFSLGATNSNVALICMLVVAGSGLFGRYFYANIHHGLHGRKATLAELKDYSDRLRHVSSEVMFLPDLAEKIGREEDRLVADCSRVPLLLRPAASAVLVPLARRRLNSEVRLAMHATTVALAQPAQPKRLSAAAAEYVDARLTAARRVVEFAAFERLFSMWHALHMPLFLMLLIAGTVHVVAVHVY